jgi:hypothetical protein
LAQRLASAEATGSSSRVAWVKGRRAREHAGRTRNLDTAVPIIAITNLVDAAVRACR